MSALVDQLTIEFKQTESFFQRHLLQEDIERIKKLDLLLNDALNKEEFVKQGYGVGWTSGDIHTFKIKECLSEFLSVYFETMMDHSQDDLLAAWRQFNRNRMEKLVGCL